MELAKANLLSVSLNDNFLASNFTAIENYLKEVTSDISVLFKTTTAIVEKINDLDPFDEIAIP